MSFIVQYRNVDSTEPVHETFDDRDAAVSRLERLLNDESVVNPSLFREVPVKVETVVKVTIEDGASSEQEPEPAEPAPPTVSTVSEPPPGAMPLTPTTVASTPADQATPPADEGRKGRFSR